MLLPSQEIVSTHVYYSNKGICALLTQLSGRYIEKTMRTLPRDCTYSAAKLPSWLESILIIVSVYSEDPVIDSREDQPEWPWRASCRAAYRLQEFKEKKNSLVPDISPLTSPLWVVFLLWLDAHNLMRGLPPVEVHLQTRGCLHMISQQYVAKSAKIISFETNCCKVQNTARIMHLAQTWILRVIGSPSTDSSVEAHEETRALWIIHTQLRMSLGSRTFLSPLLSPSWSVCLSISLCPLYSRLLWILPIFGHPHLFSRTVH